MHSQDQFCHPPLTVSPRATASLWWIYPTISWQVLWIPGTPQNLALFRNCKFLRSFVLPIVVMCVIHFQYVIDWFYNTPNLQATKISRLPPGSYSPLWMINCTLRVCTWCLQERKMSNVLINWCYRYLDNNFINGTLDITQLFALGLLSTKSPDKTPSLGPPLGLLTVLSLRNNSISNVVCNDHTIDNIATIFR
jgi:hypothetical protein